MNIKVQVFMVIASVAAIAYYNNRAPDEANHRGRGLSTTDSHPQEAAQSKKVLPHTNHRISSHPELRTRNEPIHESVQPPTAQQRLAVVSRNIDIPRDLGLDDKITREISSLLTAEKRARDFLVYEVGVTPEKLERIQKQRVWVNAELAKIQKLGDSLAVKNAKTTILLKHTLWMQSTIGVGYYNKFQELSQPFYGTEN